jgi:hypothetical protein
MAHSSLTNQYWIKTQKRGLLGICWTTIKNNKSMVKFKIIWFYNYIIII